VLQLIYHEDHTWSQHKEFWIKSALAMLGGMLLPVVYSFGLEFVFDHWVKGDLGTLTGSQMVLFPLIGALLLMPFFWGARGLALFMYVKRYPLQFAPPPAPK